MRALVLLLAACGSSASTPPTGDDDVGPDASGGDPPATACQGREAQPLDATWTIGDRIARVHVPASYDPTKRTPIVVDIHGRTQNASQQMALTHSIAKSDAEGFIAIYPESATSPTSWNAGTCCDPASTNNLDDIGYLTAVLDEAESKLCVDTDRVFMMGMSNGGYLTQRSACELSDRIAAAGPVAGLLLFASCSPSRAVPIMMVNGTADTLSQFQYVGQGVDFWVANNGCTTTTQSYQQGDATCVTHGGCTGGADVVLCTIDGGGHQWPGGDTLPFLGKKSDNLITTDAMWAFFQAHPR